MAFWVSWASREDGSVAPLVAVVVEPDAVGSFFASSGVRPYFAAAASRSM